MGLQFRIFNASNTGDYYAGGVVTPIEANRIVPASYQGPARGDGPKFIYKKYFLNITEYSSVTGQPVISNVSVTSIGETSATLNWDVDKVCTPTVTWGTNYEYQIDSVSLGSAASGSKSFGLYSLVPDTFHQFKITEVDTGVPPLSKDYYGVFYSADLTAPSVTNGPISQNVTNSTARIVWTTDEASTSRVFFTSGGPEQSTTLDSSLVLDHVVGLANLSGSTTYNYYAVSIDDSNNSGRYPSAGYFSFQTLGGGGVPALTISNVQSGNINDNSARITWTTSNAGNTVVRYSLDSNDITGNGTNYSVVAPGGAQLNTTAHTGELTSLTAGQDYYFNVRTTDTYGQIAVAGVDETYKFTTTNVNTLPVATWVNQQSYPTSGVVQYSSNETCTGFLHYATKTYYDANLAFTGIVTGTVGVSFTTAITGLSQNTRYKYQIRVMDSDGNIGFEPGQTVRSLDTIDNTAPILSNIVSGALPEQLSFNWSTNELSDTVVRIGNGTIGSPNYFTGGTGNNGNNVLSHNISLSGFTPSTSYVFELSSKDIFNNTGFYTGTVSTTAGGGLDTTPPVLLSQNHTAGSNNITFNWITNEFSSTKVYYGTTNPPTLSKQGQSGTIHTVNVDGLTPNTSYFYKLESTDAANNTLLTSALSIETQDDQSSNSNFPDGTNVALIELEVPDYGPGSFIGEFIPIRVCVPVQDDNDLILPWKTQYGHYVQREVIKRDGGGNAKIVECIFPINIFDIPVGIGATFSFYLIADSSVSIPGPLTPFSLPNTNVISYYGNSVVSANGNIATASFTNDDLTQANRGAVVMRGDSSSPYCKTTRLYRRMTVPTTNNYHPTTKGMGVHLYITQYDKTLFPDFYIQIDARVNNAWINEASPQEPGIANTYWHLGGPDSPPQQPTRGGIYYRTIVFETSSISPNDGILYSSTDDINEFCTSSRDNQNLSSTTLSLVKPMQIMPPPINPIVGKPNIIFSSEDHNLDSSIHQANYNAYFNGPSCDHMMFAGSALMFRLGLYDNSASSEVLQLRKTRMAKLAGLHFIGYTIKDTATSSRAVRNWSNTRSFTPSNIYCPTISGNYSRAQHDLEYAGAVDALISAFTNGTYTPNTIAGAPFVQGDSQYYFSNTWYGPYRPIGFTAGMPEGGFQITPFMGFNHSKNQTLFMVYHHKMRSAREFHRVYSTLGTNSNGTASFSPTYEFGAPSSYEFWARNNWTKNTTVFGPGGDIQGLIPFQQYVQAKRPVYFEFKWSNISNDERLTAPWNRPANIMTDAQSPSEGCWYNEDRAPSGVNGAKYWEQVSTYGQVNQAYPDQFKLERYWEPISDSHQILYTANMIGASEMINDLLIKDDLLQIAEFDMIAYAPKPTNASIANPFTIGYNYAERFYGYNRGSYAYPGVYNPENKHKGQGSGRSVAWTQWAIAAAYQLAVKDQGSATWAGNGPGYPKFRDLININNGYAYDFFKLAVQLYSEAYITENGAFHEGRHSVSSLEQHPGLSCNGIPCYLVTDVDLGLTSGIARQGAIRAFENKLKDGTANNNGNQPIPLQNTNQQWTLIYVFDDLYDYSASGSGYENGSGSPYAAGYLIDDDHSYRTLIINEWINYSGSSNSFKAWEISLKANGNTGNVINIKAEVFLAHPLGEIKISDPTYEQASQQIGSSLSEVKWTIRQKTTLQSNPGNTSNNEIRPHYYLDNSPTLSSNPNDLKNIPLKIRIKIYAQSLSNSETLTVDGTSIKVNLPIRHKVGDIYDAGQTFEHGLLSNSFYAIASQIVKRAEENNSINNPILSGANTTLTQIARFWSGFYSVPPIDLIPGTRNSSTWGKRGNGYVETWMVTTSKSDAHPENQSGLSWPTVPISGRYTIRDGSDNDPFTASNDDDYVGHIYTPGFSSMIAALCSMELGSAWSNNPTTTNPGTPPFFLDKWRKLGVEHPNVNDHITWLYSWYLDGNNSATPDVLQNSALGIGLVNYYNENPNLALAPANTTAVNNVKIYIQNISTPTRIELASTAYLNDTISGASTVNSEGDVNWLSSSLSVSDPEFAKAKGRKQAITLYNQDGVYGGPVIVDDDYTKSIPFWVKYRIDENISSRSGYIDIGILVGDGALGDAITTDAPDNSIPNNALYNDPTTDLTTTLGAESAGTNSVTNSSDIITFSFVGDETIQYKLNFNAGSGNINGAIRMYEATSDSWPVYNGGLIYRRTNGATYSPSTLTGSMLLSTSGINGNSFTASFTGTIEGDSRESTYIFTITGKSMRIRMMADTSVTSYSGNWGSATLSLASGCDNAVVCEVYGNGTTPTAMFDGPSDSYYWSAVPDFTQSNSLASTSPNPAGKTFSNGLISNFHYTLRYGPNDQPNTILAPVDETFVVTISSKYKDTIVKSTAPKSPYLDQLRNSYHITVTPGSEDQFNWTNGNSSFDDLNSLCQEWGMENIFFQHFFEWTSISGLQTPGQAYFQNQGPRWYPAVNEEQFVQYHQNVRAANNKIGVYIICGYIFSGHAYWNSDGIAFPDVLCKRSSSVDGDYVGIDGYKATAAVTWSGLSGFIPEAKYETQINWQEVKEIHRRYDVNFIMDDTLGVGIYWHPMGIDESSVSQTKSIKEAIIERKKMVDLQRYITNGPTFSEGSNLDNTTDMCWIWHGYLDSLSRSICINTGLSSFASIPADAYRSPQNYHIIPEHDVHLYKNIQINHGVGMSDRFHNAAGEDVQNPRAAGATQWDGSQLFPYTTGMIRREHAYCVTYLRNPYRISYSSSNAGNEAPHQIMLLDYYMCMPAVEYLRDANVTGINYYTGNIWQDFDTQFKLQKNTTSFTGVGVRLLCENGAVAYINHNRSSTPYSFDINSQLFVDLYRDDFIIYNESDGFIAFNGSVSGQFGQGPNLVTGNSNGNKITYLYRPQLKNSSKLEVFHGYGTSCSGFGNIATTGENTSQIKILNYDKNKTIYGITGTTSSSITYPEIVTFDGISP